jgi:hypothetical protein
MTFRNKLHAVLYTSGVHAGSVATAAAVACYLGMLELGSIRLYPWLVWPVVFGPLFVLINLWRFAALPSSVRIDEAGIRVAYLLRPGQQFHSGEITEVTVDGVSANEERFVFWTRGRGKFALISENSETWRLRDAVAARAIPIVPLSARKAR